MVHYNNSNHMKIEKDIIGHALTDYYFHKEENVILIHSPDFEEDEIPVSWYFRSFDQMPGIEKTAMSLCKGEILDLGAGAGSHSLYLKSAGKKVTAADISEGACKVMKERGIEKVWKGDIYSIPQKPYDTVLMMMNGIGITGTINGLEDFLDYLPKIVAGKGQLIFDSSNLIYLFQNDEGIAQIDLNERYYGEIDFQMEYKNQKGDHFQWLYVDFDTISGMCEKRNYKIELLDEGDNLQYLARILF